MGCKQLFVNLGGSGGAITDGFLKTDAALSSTLQVVKDYLGNSSILNLSTTAINVGSGTITNNGILTIKGSGANLLSLRDNLNAEKAYFTNSGVFYLPFIKITGSYAEVQTGGYFQVDSRSKFGAIADGVSILSNYNGSGFTRLIFGTNDASGSSLVKNGTALRIMDGLGTTYTTIEPLEILTRAPSGGTAKKIKFGERIAITDGGLTALGVDSQWLVEIDTVNYYILGGTTQFS